MPAASRRLLILSAREIEALYGLPRFTEADRALYFEWSPAEREAIDAVHTFSAALHLALQLGYFKAKAQFFVYEREAVLDDIRYLLAHHFPDRELADVKPLSKPTRLLQQRTILDLYGYQVCDSRPGTEGPATRPVLNTATLHSSGDTAVSGEPAHRRARVYLPAGSGGTNRDRRTPTADLSP